MLVKFLDFIYFSYVTSAFSLFQDGVTPAHKASQYGHTELLALLLANKADANAATSVIQSKQLYIKF